MTEVKPTFTTKYFMSGPIYALIDCNNFYASCERVFNPSLKNKPVAILSNNDGCVIARSPEAKQAGITMGTPEFKLRELFHKQNVAVLSSNYALYGDMSCRMLRTLREFTPHVEPYSIDEAFIRLPESYEKNLNYYGHHIKQKIWRWTGLPVSVGIGSSKTLAKIANETAKSNSACNGVLSFVDNPELDTVLETTNISDIWGIGRGFSRRLFDAGITNALQLKHKKADMQWVRNRLKVNGVRTVMELNGEACLEIAKMPGSRKGIMTSRSFGKPIAEQNVLNEAIADFISIAAQKLRAQQSVASLISITIRTSKYVSRNRSNYKHGIEISLPMPTANTPDLIRYAQAGVSELFQQGKRYKKAAVMLLGIIPEEEIQADLFANASYSKRQHRLMQKVDHLNQRYGKRTTLFAGSGIEQPWQMKQQYLSRRYTTQWDELMRVRT